MHLNGHQVACYACEDRGTERVIVTQLAEALPIKDRDIAKSFGLHPVSLSRFKTQAREAAAKQGKPMMIDFSAEWCVICKEMDAGPFSDEEVVRATEGVIPVRVDLTWTLENSE